MNNYNDFEVKDWLEDQKFQNWVYRGEANWFWLTFLENTPSQRENIEQAKNILLSVRGELASISDEEVKTSVSELLDTISNEDKNNKMPWWKGKWLQVAAVVLLTTGFGTYYWERIFTQPQPYYLMMKQLKATDMNEVVNNGKTIKLVNLPDGSSVILKENSRISYPHKFASGKREVYLLGEAFFEVEKNPDQPFYVYAGEMATRVTGTSFSVQANEKDKEVKLVVKTGIVEVSALEYKAGAMTDLKTEKITLSPNQLVTLNRADLGMKTKQVDRPVLINLSIESQDFSFKRTPLKEAFKTLEMTYGIKINFDNSIINKCTITARLGDEPIYEKLDMICTVVNARFESRNGIITVFSHGCNE